MHPLSNIWQLLYCTVVKWKMHSENACAECERYHVPCSLYTMFASVVEAISESFLKLVVRHPALSWCIMLALPH